LAASKGVYDGGLIDKSSTSRINKVTLIPFRITSSALNTPELTSLSAQMLAPDTLESVPVLSDACFVITVKGDAIDLKSSERGKLSACPKCRGGGVMLRHVEAFSYGAPKNYSVGCRMVRELQPTHAASIRVAERLGLRRTSEFSGTELIWKRVYNTTEARGPETG